MANQAQAPSSEINFADALSITLNADVAALEGMTSKNERRFLQWYAQHVFSGVGALVDLGSWMGSSTAALAAGLAARRTCPVHQGKVHAFDAFVWQPWMDASSRKPGRYRPGESFLPQFKQATAPWSRWIKPCQEDLLQFVWSGGPIEMIFVDAMKSWDLAAAIAGNFFPALIPRRSLIAHQDFKHHNHPWIHLLMYRLRDYCRPLYSLPASSTVVFSVVKPMDHAVCTQACDYSSFTLSEIEKAFAYARKLCSGPEQFEIDMANVMCFVYLARNKFRNTPLKGQENSRALQFLMQYVKF